VEGVWGTREVPPANGHLLSVSAEAAVGASMTGDSHIVSFRWLLGLRRRDTRSLTTTLSGDGTLGQATVLDLVTHRYEPSSPSVNVSFA
jgi:hypothetical protein